jgi:hypothetical protein
MREEVEEENMCSWPKSEKYLRRFLIRILGSKFKARVFPNVTHCIILERNVTEEADVSSFVM